MHEFHTLNFLAFSFLCPLCFLWITLLIPSSFASSGDFSRPTSLRRLRSGLGADAVSA